MDDEIFYDLLNNYDAGHVIEQQANLPNIFDDLFASKYFFKHKPSDDAESRILSQATLDNLKQFNINSNDIAKEMHPV